jgi:surface carbohydrate biosynthesis protein
MNRSEKKPVLYLIMEIKARELEGRTLLALEAASRGFRVVIGHKGQINIGIYSGVLPKGIYFDKSLTRGKETKFEQLLKYGQVIVSQDEETGLAQGDCESFLDVRSARENVTSAEGVFCFGQYDYDTWIKRYPEAKQKIHLTGSPRIDYWRHDFEKYFQQERAGLRNRFGRFILIPSNFVGANNSYMTIEQLIEQGRANGSIRSLEDEKARRVRFADMEKMFNRFAALVKLLAEKFSDINFVVRPHPAERIHAWQDAVKRIENIHVVFEGGISPWVRAASAILHNGCTTGIEAYVSGTPAIAYTPFVSLINKEIPNRLSIQCDHEDEVSDVLTRILKGEIINDHRTPENDELIKNRLANIEGDTAAKRIVDVLETLDVPKSPPIKPGIIAYTGFLPPPNKLGAAEWNAWARGCARIFLNKITWFDNKSRRKFPGLKLEELEQIQNNLAAVTDKYNDCKITHLYGDVFVVEKN